MPIEDLGEVKGFSEECFTYWVAETETDFIVFDNAAERDAEAKSRAQGERVVTYTLLMQNASLGDAIDYVGDNPRF